MAARRPAQVDLDEHGPLVLAGTPDALRGVLRLRNPGERQAVVREVALVDRDPALRAAPWSQRVRTTVVRGGQQRSLPVSLALDPTTPPGEHRLTLRVGEHEREVVVHVAESIAVEVAPNPLVVENRPRETVRKAVVVANRGNVSIRLGEIGAVVLDDERLACRSLRATVAALGETDDDEGVTVARTLTQLAREFKTTLEQAGRLRIRNASGVIDVEPGEVAKLELEIEVPESLEPRSRFFGRVAVYDTDLELVVVPARPADEKPAPRRPRGRRGPTSSSTSPAPGRSSRRAT
ncbi:MAG: hypothetical protein ICV71_01270 [Thermoleophilia bacterium]|nr:hypothetical protein [Thermoleophilia bacterium]